MTATIKTFVNLLQECESDTIVMLHDGDEIWRSITVSVMTDQTGRKIVLIKRATKNQFSENHTEAELRATIEELRESMLQSITLLPSQVCAKYNYQTCFACNDADCGDNITPSIVRLKKQCREGGYK